MTATVVAPPGRPPPRRAAAGADPTGVVGGRVTAWGGNLRLGGPCAVVEADEYDRSFLALTPSVAVVLNVEADHLDIYRDLADIAGAFAQFLAPARTVVRCADDAGAMALTLGAGQDDLTAATDRSRLDAPTPAFTAHRAAFPAGSAKGRPGAERLGPSGITHPARSRGGDQPR